MAFLCRLAARPECLLCPEDADDENEADQLGVVLIIENLRLLDVMTFRYPLAHVIMRLYFTLECLM